MWGDREGKGEGTERGKETKKIEKTSSYGTSISECLTLQNAAI